MIIDFSVKNFRSFRAEQRISFIASNYDKDLPGSVIELGLPGLDGVKLLKALAIYGATAAGKSNVLMAMMFLDHFVENSATDLDEGDPTGVEPFVLCPECPKQPSEFGLRFVVEGVRYHFALVVDQERVLYESLSAFPEGVERVWYERSWNEETATYDWSPHRPTGLSGTRPLWDTPGKTRCFYQRRSNGTMSSWPRYIGGSSSGCSSCGSMRIFPSSGLTSRRATC